MHSLGHKWRKSTRARNLSPLASHNVTMAASTSCTSTTIRTSRSSPSVKNSASCPASTKSVKSCLSNWFSISHASSTASSAMPRALAALAATSPGPAPVRLTCTMKGSSGAPSAATFTGSTCRRGNARSRPRKRSSSTPMALAPKPSCPTPKNGSTGLPLMMRTSSGMAKRVSLGTWCAQSFSNMACRTRPRLRSSQSCRKGLKLRPKALASPGVCARRTCSRSAGSANFPACRKCSALGHHCLRGKASISSSVQKPNPGSKLPKQP
mmetsp:Transcript_93591/g.302900  ORF Transcript_93591/g.302900 Transcript_93591/m.302900 type:complete len:267 (+) Transcript_93591:1175-1975(+)